MHKAKWIVLVVYVSLFTHVKVEASMTEGIRNWIEEKLEHSRVGELKYGKFSSDSGRYYYELGGTDLTSPTFGINNTSTTLLDFHASAGISYSCGNLSANYAATLDRLNQSIRNLPSNLRDLAASMLESGIAALPMYILNEANPVLAQVLSNSMFTLDENFRMTVKSCEQLESSILAGNGIGDWVTFNISKGMQEQLPVMQVGEQSISADEFVTRAQQNANCAHRDPKKRGVQWLEGEYYGDSTRPLRIEEHTITAGYNALRGYKYSNQTRVALLNNTGSATAQQMRDKPIFRTWKSPAEAANFVKKVIGSRSVSLCAGEAAKVSVDIGTGSTLKAEYDHYKATFQELILKIIYQPSELRDPDYKSLGSLEISTALIEKMRRQKRTTQAITVSKLASAYAYEKTRKLALDAINLMRIGSQTQYIASATPAKKYIEEAIQRLTDDISDLKQSAEPNKAADIILQILDH